MNLEDERHIRFIEYKTKIIHSTDMGEEIEKLRRKSKEYKTNKIKKIEFWFWHKPEPKISKILYDNGIKFKILEELVSESPIFRHKKKDKLYDLFGTNRDK